VIECVLALLIWHVKRTNHILLSSVVCLVLPYFSTLPHKRYDFRGKGKTSQYFYHIWRWWFTAWNHTY